MNKQQIKNNHDYWRNRFELLEEMANNKSKSYLIDLKREYETAINTMENKLAVWYQRYAKNEGISMAEAQKRLDKKELKEFRMTVDEYIKKGKTLNYSDEFKKELERASVKVHVDRLQALEFQLEAEIERLHGGFATDADALLKEMYGERYNHTMFEIQKGFGVGFSFNQLDNRHIEKVLSKPWTVDEKTFSKRIWSNNNKLVNEVHTILTQGAITGVSYDEMTKNLAKRFMVSYSNAERLVVTESAFFASAAQSECFNELNVEEYEIIATLDLITSPICREMDGVVFPMSKFEPGVTAPPFHCRCRTTTAPSFNDEFEEGVMRAARDPETGKTVYVPADMKYNEWLDRYGQQNATKAPNSPDGTKSNKKGDSKNKSSMIESLYRKHGINLRDSREYPIDEEILSGTIDWLDSFKSLYPGFMKKNPCKIPLIEVMKPEEMKESVVSYEHREGTRKVNRIKLNGEYFSDIEYLRNYNKRCVEIGWHPQNSTEYEQIIHDYGHHVSKSLRWITGNKSWECDFLNECLDEFKKSNKTIEQVDLKRLVSEYAEESENELFAELFAENYGGDHQRELARIFGRKLDKLLRGV